MLPSCAARSVISMTHADRWAGTSHRPAAEHVRVLIVDDEPLAGQRVKDLLAEQPDVSVIGMVEEGEAAIEAIRSMRPDIVFLDVQIPHGNGLEVVRRVGPELMPATVFVTAYDEFAVEAFELAASDYLLKPYSDERFDEAFRRARSRLAIEDLEALRDQLRIVLETGAGLASGPGRSPYLQRIAVHSRGKLLVVPIGDIDHIVASGVYAEVCRGTERHLVRASLNTLEANLDPQVFFRLHRSAIVRLDAVTMLLREGGGSYVVQLVNGTKLSVGRSRREELEGRLGRL
jgi:two-component system LytT family response regulator